MESRLQKKFEKIRGEKEFDLQQLSTGSFSIVEEGSRNEEAGLADKAYVFMEIYWHLPSVATGFSGGGLIRHFYVDQIGWATNWMSPNVQDLEVVFGQDFRRERWIFWLFGLICLYGVYLARRVVLDFLWLNFNQD
ncbi:MAG: hypothetical protein H6581_05325 [Bacteroidia bacterium]|nr:hypothetical protein [Bacteroidia bacterium]